MTGRGSHFPFANPARLARALRAWRDDGLRSNIFFTTYHTLKFLARHRADQQVRTPRPLKNVWIRLAHLSGVTPNRRGPATVSTADSESELAGCRPEKRTAGPAIDYD
jgi:hypothetical protein